MLGKLDLPNMYGFAAKSEQDTDVKFHFLVDDFHSFIYFVLFFIA